MRYEVRGRLRVVPRGRGLAELLLCLCVVMALALALRPAGGADVEEQYLAEQRLDELELRQADELPDSVDGVLAMLADEGEPCWREAQHRWSVFVARVAQDPEMLNSTGDALAEVVGACGPEEE